MAFGHAWLGWLVLAIASIAAGLVNAVAGGGTLLSFPTLTAIGLPAIAANVTNTVALSPGYLGGTLAQRDDLVGQRSRLVRLVPSAMLGGVAGGVLLLVTSDTIFRRVVPFLVLIACASLASQERIRGWLADRTPGAPASKSVLDVLAVFVAAIYGGYFGAGLGIILLAVLGVVIDDTLVRINALKQALSFTINVTAACFFLFSGKVVWPYAALMAVGSLVGGNLGGRIAKRLEPAILRRVVIALGLVVACVYFVRAYLVR